MSRAALDNPITIMHILANNHPPPTQSILADLPNPDPAHGVQVHTQPLTNENLIFQNHGIHEVNFFLKKNITDNGFSDAKILTMLIILQTVFIIIMKYNVFYTTKNLYRK